MRARTTLSLIIAVGTLIAPLLVTPPASAVIGEQAVATGLANPVGFTINPADPNELWYGERNTGEVRRRNIVTSTDSLVYTVTNVLTSGEQGLLGIALDPAYPSQPYVYVYVTRSKPSGAVNMVLKITISGGVGVSKQAIFKDPGAIAFHNGGRILFGPDGMLYVIIGEHGSPANAQNLGNKPGKIHRITTTGAVPSDNPFPGNTIWAYGLRNSFGFTFDPATGFLWETDNGPECNDELNRIKKGGNYAWGPSQTCSGTAPINTNQDGPTPRRLPKFFQVDTSGFTGVAVCSSCGLPTNLDLYYGAVNNGQIHRATLDATRKKVTGDSLFWDHSGPVLSVETRPGQPIYFSDTTTIYKLVNT
jgi:glucose/arabinose dehydrogenase